MEDIQTIKWLVVAILIGMVIVAASAIFVAYVFWVGFKQYMDNNSVELFKDIAESHLSKNEINELIKHAAERLNTHPRDVWASWYMGQAKYFNGELPEAKQLFTRIRDLEPSWKAVVSAWIERIEDDLSKGPSLVK
jgi:cytochrome c-type biogenesis protein CcmH/NrfG